MAYTLQIIRDVTRPISLAELDKVESELQFHLPESYKRFVAKYGGGLICGLFNVFCPSSNKNIDLVTQNKELKKLTENNIAAGFWDGESELFKERLARLEPFGRSDNGDILAWDISRKSKGELPIYLLDSEQNSAPLVANSLDEFIEDFCIKQKIDQVFPRGQGEKWHLQPTFTPYRS